MIVVNKRKGQTPLECIKEMRVEMDISNDIPITYAGRLDPLAEGVLVLLVGDEVHEKDKYLKLSKEYEVEILFGFETDTYDVMGEVSNTFPHTGYVGKIDIEKKLDYFTGEIEQSYPPYSSRKVLGKPLFTWAREGKLGEIDIPKHKVYIESIEKIGERSYTKEELLDKIKNDISLVKGDFRQGQIIEKWEKVLGKHPADVFQALTLRVSCGSGVYVRVLANDIGQTLGLPALALNIKRTKVGEYKNP